MNQSVRQLVQSISQPEKKGRETSIIRNRTPKLRERKRKEATYDFESTMATGSQRPGPLVAQTTEDRYSPASTAGSPSSILALGLGQGGLSSRLRVQTMS